MDSPVFVICQGRTGGTMLSDLLARLPNTRYLLEPLHPRLLRNVKNQPERTAEVLRQGGIQTFPNRGYLDYSFPDLVDMHCTHQSRPDTIRAWLRFLVDGAEKDGDVPVFKVPRLFGRLHLIREEFPDAAVVHLYRPMPEQRASYQRVGFPGDYFGDCSGHGLAPDQFLKAWDACYAEAREVADVSVNYAALCLRPLTVLYQVLLGIGLEKDLADFWARQLCLLVRRRGA